MITTKSARRGPWLWIGLGLLLAAGVSIAGASRKASARVPAAADTAAAAPLRRAPATPAASQSRDASGDARADRDVCAQQLD